MAVTYNGLIILTLLLLTLAGCSSSDEPASVAILPAVTGHSAGLESPAIVKSIRLRPESVPFLSVEAVQFSKSAEPVRAPGRVDFRQQAVSRVGAQITGRVAAVRVQTGDPVRAGDVLMELYSPDAAAARAALSTARANVRLAEHTVERQAQMLARGIGIELEKFEADRQLAETSAEFDRASRTVQLLGEGEGTQVAVKAPISGTLLKLNTTVGAVVEPGGEPLAEIGDARALWIVAEVFEHDLPFLEHGDEVSVDLSVSPGRSLRGKVTALGAVFSDEQRRAPVYIELTESTPNLRPGMYARMAIHPRHPPEHVHLPPAAVLIKDGKRTVVYVETAEGVYEQRPVTIGESVNGKVPVLEGIRPNERVVVRGALLLDGEAEQML